MCGAYIGVDEYRSKLAVLTERFAPESVSPTNGGVLPVDTNQRSVWNLAL
jgi:trimethyllysine dioxygenase